MDLVDQSKSYAGAGLAPVSSTLSGRVFLAVAASAFVALSAHVALPLPFTPVPLTLSTMAVLMVGLFVSPGVAFSAMLLYLAEGAMGLPVFAPGGPTGIAHMLGSNAGYLFAYPVAAAVASAVVRLARPIASRFVAAVAACGLASLVFFACGATWLATLLHLHAGVAVKLGVMPFLPGEALKIAAAAGVYSGIERWRKA